MREYTPTTDWVRTAWVIAREKVDGIAVDGSAPEFDRWLAAHDAEVAEAAYQRGHEAGFWNGKTTDMTPNQAAEYMAPYRSQCPTCAAQKRGA